MEHNNPVWPIFVKDRKGRSIYLTQERWEHALEHPGMGESQLKQVLETLRAESVSKMPTTRQNSNIPELFKIYQWIIHTL